MPTVIKKPRDIYRLGSLEFDPSQHELRDGDHRTSLTPSLNRLLLLLVSRHGELVTREEIAATLWEQQETVSVAPGINMAIKRLRTQIGDGNGHGTLIETVVGVGYRFVAPVSTLSLAVEEVETPEEESGVMETITASDAPVKPDDPAELRAQKSWLPPKTGWVFLALAIATGAVTYAVHLRERKETEARDRPFALNGRPATYDEPEDHLTAQAISPSGTYVAYRDDAGLTVQTLATGVHRLLNLPRELQADHIAWFPDESAILVDGAMNSPGDQKDGIALAKSQTWIVPMAGGPAKLFLDDSTQAAVAPDGLHVAYLHSDRDQVWIANADGTSPHRLLFAGDSDIYRSLLWSSTGKAIVLDRQYRNLPRLAGSDFSTGSNQVPAHTEGSSVYETYDAQSGALLFRREGIGFDSAALLKDGTLLFPVNPQTGPASLGYVRTDPSTAALLSSPQFIATQKAFSITASVAAQFSASTDSKKLSALVDRGATTVYTADLSNASPDHMLRLEDVERLTHHVGTTYPTSWSPDSSEVIFDNGIGGPDEVAAEPVGSGTISVIAASQSPSEKFAQGRVSSDGRWVLFLNLNLHTDRLNAIERVPLKGGIPQVVPTSGEVKDFRCSTSAAGRCVVREVEGKNYLVWYALYPVAGMGAELARIPWQPNMLGDWSVSPDGNTIAMANHDREHPAIRLVSLKHGNSGSGAVTEIPVSGFGTVLTANWAADGHSFFVETYPDPNYNLLSVSMDGHTTLLRQSPQLIWAVPSPDGKKVAFPAVEPLNRNVWITTTDLTALR